MERMASYCLNMAWAALELSMGDPAYEDLAEWQSIQARRIQRLARPFEQEIVEHALGSIGRHEYAVDDHIPASSGLKAGDVPGIDGLILPPRH